MRVLVTHAAGVLGFHTARRLAAEGHTVHAQLEPDSPIDEARAHALSKVNGIHLRDEPVEWSVDALRRIRPEIIVHFVRLPSATASAPLAADAASHALAVFPHLLDAALEIGTQHLLLGSSVAVYGASDKLPFGTEQLVDRHYSLRGAVFRSLELVAHAFAHAHSLPVTALRYFSVYGPWGDPALPPMSYLRALRANLPVELVDGGQLRRDFVYVDDAVESTVRALERVPDAMGELPQFAVHNVGTGNPTPLVRALELCEQITGRTAERVEVPVPRTDVPHTWADVRSLQQTYGFRPRTPLSEGLTETAHWLEQPEATAWR